MFCCTSAGAFRFVDLSKFKLTNDENEGSINHIDESELDGATTKWSVPGPLYHVAFYPGPGNVLTHFAYGGEHVPLSLWDVKNTLDFYQNGQTQAKGKVHHENQSKTTDDEVSVGKRKSPSSNSRKMQELRPGEIWRARNVSSLANVSVA